MEQASPWVVRFAPLLPPGGEVLDLACGGGRHARLLARRGHTVLAVDRDGALLAGVRAPGIDTLEFDLESGAPWPFEAARFAAIVVTNYLHRPLFADLIRSLAEGGVLIYETFADGNQRFGRPARADFLLRRGELLDVARIGGLHVLAYEDGCTERPKPAIVQRICAVRTSDPACLRLD